MDRVNRSILTAENLEQMMSNTLGCVLDIFDSDRAWLVYPCDPNTSSWRVPMERTKPEYPGALALGVDVPIDPQVIELFNVLLATNDPVGFGPGSEYPAPSEIAQRFEFKSQLTMAVYPKVGKPWVFGIHQCSYPRVWKPDERRLFKEIGWRITDGLSSLLIYRELDESEKKYHQIVDTASEGIWVLGPDVKTTLINNRMIEMLGYSNDEVIGRPMSDFMFEEDVPDHLKKIEDRRRGISETYERRFRRKNGQTLWAIVSAAPILDNERHFNGSFAMLTDITGRKHTEDALRKQLGMNLAMFNQAVVSLALMGLDYRFVQVNRAYAAYFKKTPEDLKDKSIFGFQSATQKQEEIKALFDNVVKTKKALNLIDFQFVFKDRPELGITYWDSTFQPIFDEHGEVEFLFFLAVDVTGRKQAEDELIKSEQKYRELFEDSLDGIFVTSPAGEIIDVNKKAVSIFGYNTKDEVLHLNLARDVYVNAEDRERVLEKIDKQGCGEFDIAMKKRNGKRFIAHSLVTTARDENGTITSYRGIIRDVAEHKKVEII
jgi:PAS domain S-box-containing protein